MEEMTKCPECKRRTLKREGEELVCTECHGRFPAPLEKKSRDLFERHRFYESNKQEIIQDLMTLGRKATREKWKIGTGSTLFTLEKRWLTAEQREVVNRAGRTVAGQTPSTNNRLPQFPEFDSSWEPQVQVMWFEVYGKLLEKQGGQR